MRLLVIRFSAMGDVALLAPVLSALESRHSALTITLVTRRAFEPFFHAIPGVEVVGVNLEDYRGITGIYRLFKELMALGPYDFGIDVHASLRSRLLKAFFKSKGLSFATIVKGRREKRLHTRRKNKILEPLPHVVDRYMHVFERAGFSAETGAGPWINPDTRSRQLAKDYLTSEGLNRKENYWIGIAPFAGHEPKMWPLLHMKELLHLIREKMDATLFLFGGGKREVEELERLREDDPRTHVVAGKLNLEGEMGLVLKLDIMLAMDSFNMHMAALLGIPLLSIWGATHPYSGFGPYGRGESSVIQVPVEKLSCRPCSIFGDRSCFRGDLACLNWISAGEVYDRLASALDRTGKDAQVPQTD